MDISICNHCNRIVMSYRTSHYNKRHAKDRFDEISNDREGFHYKYLHVIKDEDIEIFRTLR